MDGGRLQRKKEVTKPMQCHVTGAESLSTWSGAATQPVQVVESLSTWSGAATQPVQVAESPNTWSGAVT